MPDEPAYCYLTTTGRRTGQPHEIEIWFTALDESLYLISGGLDHSDWVQNLQATPAATVRIGSRDGDPVVVVARTPMAHGDERTAAVTHLHAKYGDQVTGSEADWQRDAFIVALDRTSG